jgi:threonyl-tRNA synthetase
MLVAGDKEKESNTVSVRIRSGKDLGSMPLNELITLLNEEIKNKGY